MPLDNINLIDLITKVGGLGVAVYAIYSLTGTINNHIGHNTDALKDLTVVLGELKELIKHKLKE